MEKKTVVIAGIEYVIDKQGYFKGHALNTKPGSAYTKGAPKENKALYWIGKLTGVNAVDGDINPSLRKLSKSDATQICSILFNKPKVYSQKYIEQCRKVVAKTQGF